MRFVTSLLVVSTASSLAVLACGSSRRSSFADEPPPSSTEGPSLPAGPVGTGGGPGFGDLGDGGAEQPADPDDRDPVDCDEAAKARSYVGCDYWPTVTGNVVPDVFDFAVVVSNIGDKPADVTVTGPNGVDLALTVAPGSLEKIFLPWVPALKGPGQNRPGTELEPFEASTLARKGAYHLVSSVPVVVYQFNPLEYAGKGGPPGKDWSKCPELGDKGTGCLAYSNDASLLLPSTAWTGTYRITGIHGWSSAGVPGVIPGKDFMGSYAAITAAEDGTLVRLHLGAKAQVVAGDGISEAGPGTTIEIALDAGDVAQVLAKEGESYDLSGSLVTSSKPVQVISGIQCINLPKDKPACDHVEESVLPAEALGRRYVVTTPTRPKGGPGLHVVRFVGNRDGTKLTYSPAKPDGCPDTLAAGEVATCDGTVAADFVVSGNHEFGVTSFMVASSLYEKATSRAMGDPSQTIFASLEQYRTSYLFLTPDDYEVSYAVVVGPEGAAPVLDGEPLDGYTSLAEGLGVWRVTLTTGAHKLTSSLPVGLQAMGYGAYTSYEFPGGLNLKIISPPPPPTK